MKPKYFDIHSHINFSAFDADRDEVIQRMHNDNVRAISVGTDLKTSREVVDLASKHDGIFATVGLHPDDNRDEVFDPKKYEEFLLNKKVVAVGECGLDYFRLHDKSDKKRQKENFERQIRFALLYNLPLMFHFRPSVKTMDAYKDGLEILESYKKEYGDKLRGNSHFFAGDLDVAKKFLNLDFTLSFTGVITFADSYDEVVAYTPFDMLLSETDCPFVAPVPFRGNRCEPVYVSEVVKRIAEIKDEKYEKVQKILVNNVFRVFKIA